MLQQDPEEIFRLNSFSSKFEVKIDFICSSVTKFFDPFTSFTLKMVLHNDFLCIVIFIPPGKQITMFSYTEKVSFVDPNDLNFKIFCKLYWEEYIVLPPLEFWQLTGILLLSIYSSSRKFELLSVFVCIKKSPLIQI